MSHAASTVLPRIPLVVQLGFAGSRHLLDNAAHPDLDEAEFHAQVLEHLVSMMQEMPRTLGLSERHFFCGVSQIAIGADTIFTRACMRLSIRQRIFLPQRCEAYLAAVSGNGERDFTGAQVAVAEELLRSTHIIEDRVVSQSPRRSEQFEDVNLELVGVSDVLIALRRADAEGKPGGTLDLIERARARHRPLLEITVAVKDGGPVFSDEWHWNKPESKKDHARHFTPPVLPSVMRKCVMRDGGDYAGVLKDFLSTQAGKHQWWFKKAALGIIGAHVAATVCAATGLAFKAPFEGMLRVLLGVEFLLLVIGLCWHLWLHRSQSAKRWATARLVSEVARSVNAMAQVPGDLGHLFALPLPEFLRPLLHTLNVFHLETTRTLERGMWSDRRDAYVHNRLARPDGGQIAYYAKQRRKAGSRHRFANFVFYLGGATALAATLVELLIECDCTFPGFPGWILDPLTRHHAFFEHLPGFLAIILPVLSVAALSLAASFDLEARKHTYEEMLRALEQHEEFIRGAKSEHEFAALVLQTEMRLLGENVNWFSRRVFTGVT